MGEYNYGEYDKRKRRNDKIRALLFGIISALVAGIVILILPNVKKNSSEASDPRNRKKINVTKVDSSTYISNTNRNNHRSENSRSKTTIDSLANSFPHQEINIGKINIEIDSLSAGARESLIAYIKDLTDQKQVYVTKKALTREELLQQIYAIYGHGTKYGINQILDSTYALTQNEYTKRNIFKIPLLDYPVSHSTEYKTNSYVQEFDLHTNQFTLTNQKGKGQSVNLIYSKIKKNSALVSFKYDRESFTDLLYDQRNWRGIKTIFENLNKSTFKYLVTQKFIKIIPCDGEKSSTIQDYPFVKLERLTIDISDLNFSNFGDFYLFDIFKGDSCSHGLKVYDVVKQILRNYKLDTALRKIFLIPINVFSNRQQCDSLYHQANIELGETVNYSHIVDSETFERYKNIDTLSESDYLRSVYTAISARGPDIISSSYVAQCNIPFFQTSYSEDDTATNYFAAATNDSLNIDIFRQRSRDLLEPLASYMLRYREDGAIIVGNQLAPGVIKGMYSNIGSITTLGNGVSWGLKECTKCIADTDVGTSFATPEVATKMFIAKAYWRKHNVLNFGANEARNRLILATNLQKGFAKVSAACGDINLNKLLQIKSGYLVDRITDSVISLDSIIDAAITLPSLNSLEFSSGKVENSIRGLYVDDGNFFVFQNTGDDMEKWIEIKSPVKIKIAVRFPGDSNDKNILKAEFLEKYKQFVYLK